MADKNWWEEEDKFGYTYADTERPGYMGQAPEEEEDVVSEEALEYSKLREPGGYEDPQGGDEFEEFELTEEQKRLSKTLEQEKLPDVGLPKEEPKEIKEVNVEAEKKIKSLMKKALGAKGKKRSEGYADVYEALEAYEGKETAFLKGLKSRFSKKASDTKNRQHLGDYVDYVKQGRSWSSSRPSRASVPRETDYTNTVEYDQEAILSNANNLKDGVRIRGNRPQIMIGDDEYSVTSNHMENSPSHSMKNSNRSSQLLLKDGKVVKHPDGNFNYGLDLINNDGKIRNILGGKIHKIEKGQRLEGNNYKYPTGYGKRLIVKTNKQIMVDGKPYTLFVHYAHATNDSFNDLNVGDSLEAGEEVGTMGRTGEYGRSSTMGVHLDLNGYIMKDGKKVYVSPSEFLPKGGLSRPQGFREGGEATAFKIPDLIPVDARGDRQGKKRKVTKQERADVQKLWGTYSPEAKKNLLDRFQRGTLSASQVAGEMIQELREEKEGVDRGFYKEERKPEKQTKRSVRKKVLRKKQPQWTGDPTRKMAGRAKDAKVIQDMVSDRGGFTPQMIIPTYLDSKLQSQTETDGRDVKKRTRRVKYGTPAVARYKQRRDPETGKVVDEVRYEKPRPWHERGGKFPTSQTITVTGDPKEDFKDKDYISEFETPYDKLTAAGMVAPGKTREEKLQDLEFRYQLGQSPRDFSDMPKERVDPVTGEKEYVRSDLRQVAGLGDSEDLELRYFGEAYNRADEAGKARLERANPELLQEYKRHRGFDEGGEVSSEFDFEDMGSGQDYIDSMQYDMPEYATRPDLRQPQPSGPVVPGVPEVQPVVDQPDTVTGAVDVESLVKGYVEGGKTFEDREQLRILVDQGVTTREEVSSLIEKYDRPEQEDVVAQGGREPRTPPGPMERKALGLDKKPPRKNRGATGSFDEDISIAEDITLDDPPATKKRPPLTDEKKQSFRDMFDKAEEQRKKDEIALRAKEDERLAIVIRPVDRKRYYKRMGTVDKVVALLSLAAGAYDAQKFGQPNLYLKQLDKAIEDDIKDQNLDIQEQAFRKAQLLHDAKILSARLARSTKDRDKKEGFLKNENTLDKAFKKQLRTQNQKVRKIKFIETLNKRGITSKEVAYADAIHPELKVGQKVIKGRDGLYYYTRGDLKKLKEYISDAQDSIDGLTQLEEYVDKVTMFEQIPGASILSKDAAGAQSLRDRLVGKLRIEFFGPGVMTDQEREQAKKILGNPNAFFSRDSVEKEKIRNLLLKINYGIRQKLRRDGLAIPESRNDRMVKAWLKRAGRPITDSNKARAVNALIAAEKKNVRLGGKPGKHWVMDEPLPI